MKKNRLFKFDFISVFTFFMLIVFSLCINSLIEIKFEKNNNDKDILYAWIRVVSSFLLCISAFFTLRKKRKEESENNK
jgi:uncharacterized BrkB/YihY/UPF0761 family membrane protein